VVWSLGVFAICVYVVYGIVVYGEEEEPVSAAPRGEQMFAVTTPGSPQRRAAWSRGPN
jgi:hypothetical protein